MTTRRLRGLLPLLSTGLFAFGCGPGNQPPASAPTEPQASAPAPTPPPPPAEPAADSGNFRAEIAILPLDDDGLFRAERQKVRGLLFDALSARLPNHRLVRLQQFDKELLSTSKSTGTRCGHDHVDAREVAERRQRAGAGVIHVVGSKSSPEQLWVNVNLGQVTVASFAAPFDPKLERTERYARSFAALVPNPGSSLVGGLAARGDMSQAARSSGVTLCEKEAFGKCKKSSTDWSDALPELSACFAGTHEVEDEVLIQSQAKTVLCELTNLDDTGGARGKLEACLCKALTKSAAAAKSAERRNLRIHFLAPALKKLPRPELRVLEASTNLLAKSNWHRPKNNQDERSLPPVRRLSVSNLDALAAPLSRCKAKAGTTLISELKLSESGEVTGAALVAGKASRALRACVEKALPKAGFSCSDNGKEARLKIAIEWPTWPAKP